jgi:hypothetical protein
VCATRRAANTSPEVNAYREHVNLGITRARRMGVAAGAVQVLAQHHEHADGSGFPGRLAGEAMSPAARIVAVVNRYDNLCNPGPRGHPLTPHEAVSLLFAQNRNKFDPAVLSAFIRMMGVYPAGSVVQLTDDRFAMVIAVNSSRPLKPRVMVHEPGVPRDERCCSTSNTSPTSASAAACHRPSCRRRRWNFWTHGHGSRTTSSHWSPRRTRRWRHEAPGHRLLGCLA